MSFTTAMLEYICDCTCNSFFFNWFRLLCECLVSILLERIQILICCYPNQLTCIQTEWCLVFSPGARLVFQVQIYSDPDWHGRWSDILNRAGIGEVLILEVSKEDSEVGSMQF